MRSIRYIVLSRFFGILLVFFSIFFIGSYLVLSNIIVQFMIRDNSTALSFIANNIQRNYFSRLTALDDLAISDGFSPFQKQRAEKLTERFLTGSNVFSNVHVYDKDGNTLFAKKRNSVTPYRVHENFRSQSNKDFITTAEEVILNGKPRVSPTFETNSGQTFHTYVVPFMDEKNPSVVAGILSGGVFPDGQKIDHLVEGLTLAEGNFIVVSDIHGHFMAQSSLSQPGDRDSVAPYILKAAQNFKNLKSEGDAVVFVESSSTHRNQSFYFLSLPIKTLEFVVTLGIGTQHIESKRQEIMFYLIITLVIGLFLGLLGSYLVGRKLSDPLHEIALSVEKMSLGDFSHRIDYKGKDELGHLCFLINRLAIKLRKDRYLGELWVTRKEADELVKHKHPDLES
jgi:hypothetical protein